VTLLGTLAIVTACARGDATVYNTYVAGYITLDPASANEVLADPAITENTIEQRVTARWVESSKAVVSSQR
jgi:hypothetical protein